MFSNRILPSYWAIDQRFSLPGEDRAASRERRKAGQDLLLAAGYRGEQRRNTKEEAQKLAAEITKKTGLELTINEASPL